LPSFQPSSPPSGQPSSRPSDWPSSPPSSQPTPREEGGTCTNSTTKLLADDREFFDYFGYSVDADGDTIIVGAWGDDDAHVFVRDDEQGWSQQAKLVASDGAANVGFGRSVAVSGNTAIVGAPWDDDRKGSVYLFLRDLNNTWSQIAKLVASDGATHDRFGWTVAIDRDRVHEVTMGLPEVYTCLFSTRPARGRRN